MSCVTGTETLLEMTTATVTVCEKEIDSTVGSKTRQSFFSFASSDLVLVLYFFYVLSMFTPLLWLLRGTTETISS